MRKMLILGSSLVSSEIVQTAKEMGCYTIVTDNLPPERSFVKPEADEYWMISTNEIDLLEQKCREEQVSAVFSGVSEFNLDRVKELTDRLNLPCYINDRSWKYARNKQLFKQKCRKIGISVVDDYALSNPPRREELEKIKYPVVVKPVDGAGNKGVSICKDEDELREAYRKARAATSKENILVERYLIGEESWNSYYIAENEFRCVGRNRAFKQPGYPSFVYSFIISAMEDNREFKEQLDEKCVKLFKSIGCREGIAWLQCIRDEKGRYHAIEMAHRISAAESTKFDEEGQGINPVRWMLETALGIEHKATMLPSLREQPYDKAYCIYFIFSDRACEISSMTGFDELDKERFLVSTIAQKGHHPDRYRLLSRIVFSVKSTAEVLDSIRLINEKVHILDKSGQNMWIRYKDLDTLAKRINGLFSLDR